MPLLRLIEEIYKTGSETHDWSGLIGHVAEYIGVQSGLVGITDFSTGFAEPSIHTHGLDPDPLYDVWVGEFGFKNPWTDNYPQLTQGQIVTGAESRPLNEFRGMPIYSDVFAPLEIDDTLVAGLSTEGSRVLFLAVYGDRRHGPFEQVDRDRMQPLVPHLVRAASLETMILDAGIREQLNRAALDEINFAIFAINGLKADPLNRAAEALVASGDGLVSRFGHLGATHLESNEVLQQSIIAAGGGLTTPPVATASPFPLRRGPGRLSLTCWTIPVSNRSETGLARLVRPGSALLFVGDPEQRPELASDTVARLFDLTPAEARVATAIATGETPREYAERQGLTQNTVRWTLKQVQSKLGLHRQLEIASVLLRAVPRLDR